MAGAVDQSVERALLNWDGKDTALLERLFAGHAAEPDFLVDLVQLARRADTQAGATWLLKHHFDTRREPLPASLVRRHLADLPLIVHWEAKLHILQYLEHLDIPDKAEESLGAFVNDALENDRKIVRAWAFYALALLAIRFPDRRSRALEILTQARTAETAGSIKVRIRKAFEKLKI